MRNIVLFDPSIATFNIGDYIIMDSISTQLNALISQSYVVRVPTHTPVFHSYQLIKDNLHSTFFYNADLKFICGTNIIKHNMLHLNPDWSVNLFNVDPYRNSILIGVGMDDRQCNSLISQKYTERLYHKIFSKEYIHSTRDEATKLYLEKLGYRAINTGCPTMWGLDSDFCSEIPKKKAEWVVFTLTDYCKNPNIDKQFINVLKDNYSKLFFWPQGVEDYEYISNLGMKDELEIISPNIITLSKFFSNTCCDYVGTRLHAGIFAMQHKKRAIIVLVDNRARDISKTYRINCIERAAIDQLNDKINSDIDTDIRININNVETWLNQFCN